MMRCSVGWDEQDCWKLRSACGPRPCKGFWMDMKKCWWVRACLRRCEKEQLLLFLLAPGLYEGEDQRADQYNQQDDLHCAKSLFFLHPFPRCLIRICNQSYNFLPATGRCWHLSVSATRLRRYSFAVSRDARRRIPTTHPHRSRPYAARQGAMQASPPPIHTAPAPTRLGKARCKQPPPPPPPPLLSILPQCTHSSLPPP